MKPRRILLSEKDLEIIECMANGWAKDNDDEGGCGLYGGLSISMAKDLCERLGIEVPMKVLAICDGSWQRGIEMREAMREEEIEAEMDPAQDEIKARENAMKEVKIILMMRCGNHELEFVVRNLDFIENKELTDIVQWRTNYFEAYWWLTVRLGYKVL